MANNSIRICTACNHIGTSRKRGSGGIELILWICYLIPGLIYHMWRNGGTECPACGSSGTIPITTPKAQAIINAENGGTLGYALAQVQVDQDKQEKAQKGIDTFIYILIGTCVLMFIWVLSLA